MFDGGLSIQHFVWKSTASGWVTLISQINTRSLEALTKSWIECESHVQLKSFVSNDQIEMHNIVRIVIYSMKARAFYEDWFGEWLYWADHLSDFITLRGLGFMGFQGDEKENIGQEKVASW